MPLGQYSLHLPCRLRCWGAARYLRKLFGNEFYLLLVRTEVFSLSQESRVWLGTRCLPCFGTDPLYPSNATSCDQCHSVPAKFGSSRLTVQRTGNFSKGRFVPGSQGGIRHRNGEPSQTHTTEITVEIVSLSLLGNGYIEAIVDRYIIQIA